VTALGGRLAVLAALVVLLAPGAARAASVTYGPSQHTDGRDVAASPLDVTSVTFGQRDTRMMLRIRARTAWSAADLSAESGRLLCVYLFREGTTSPQGRVCVLPRDGAAALRYERLDAAGAASDASAVAANVERPNSRTIAATFTPLEIGLPRGRFAWQVVSTWTDGAACTAAAPCVDRVPDARAIHDTVRLLAQPRCFGAASRDPRRACVNRALRLSVVPSPRAARRARNAACTRAGRTGLVSVCAFGVAPSQAASTIALVGDSHAQHWRGALEVVAQARRWRGLSITRSGCPYTTAVPVLPGRRRSLDCMTWNTQLRAWFGAHPEVQTVFISSHAGAKTKGSTAAGYRNALRALPSSVKRVYLIRDTPYLKPYSGCVGRALAKHQRPGPACAQPRQGRLLPDAHADAARSLHSKRVRVIDMTRYYCGPHSCLPVVGGALVFKEGGHLTSVFASTLGPFLLRAIG
jgi:hypothetical protein